MNIDNNNNNEENNNNNNINKDESKELKTNLEFTNILELDNNSSHDSSENLANWDN